MAKTEKEIILEKLMAELKEGKDEEEVRKEYETLFPKEDSWSISSKSKVPKTITTDYTPLSEEKNPLVLLAEENGAFRALMKTIRMDLLQDDEVSRRMILSSLERIQALTLHYEKMQKLVFPLLKKYGIDNTDSFAENENRILHNLKNIEEERKKGEKNDGEIKKILDAIESNIVKENRFFFPVLESNMDEIELYEMYLQERMMGFALIRA